MTAEKRDYVTVREAMDALHLSKTTVHRYISEGTLSAYQLVENGDWRIRTKSLNELLARVKGNG